MGALQAPCLHSEAPRALTGENRVTFGVCDARVRVPCNYECLGGVE